MSFEKLLAKVFDLTHYLAAIEWTGVIEDKKSGRGHCDSSPDRELKLRTVSYPKRKSRQSAAF